MKKLLVLLLSFIMSVSFIGCGQDSELASEKGTDPIRLVLLGDNQYIFNVDYFEFPITKEEAAQGLKHSYYTDIETKPDLDIYEFDKNGMTLEEYTYMDAAEFGISTPDMREDSVSRYGYYSAFQTYTDIPYITITCIYEPKRSPDKFLKEVWWYKADEIPIGDSGYAIYYPKGYKTKELSELEIADGMVASYYYDWNGSKRLFGDLDVYDWYTETQDFGDENAPETNDQLLSYYFTFNNGKQDIDGDTLEKAEYSPCGWVYSIWSNSTTAELMKSVTYSNAIEKGHFIEFSFMEPYGENSYSDEGIMKSLHTINAE